MKFQTIVKKRNRYEQPEIHHGFICQRYDGGYFDFVCRRDEYNCYVMTGCNLSYWDLIE
jgi:hypothetical protein